MANRREESHGIAGPIGPRIFLSSCRTQPVDTAPSRPTPRRRAGHPQAAALPVTSATSDGCRMHYYVLHRVRVLLSLRRVTFPRRRSSFVWNHAIQNLPKKTEQLVFGRLRLDDPKSLGQSPRKWTCGPGNYFGVS